MSWMGTVMFNAENKKYNFWDLNRENINIQYLLEELNSSGFPVTVPQPVLTGYTRTNFPYVSDLNKTRANILALIEAFYKPLEAPAIIVNPAQLQQFEYAEANALERNLQGLYELLQSMKRAYKPSGTFVSGQNTILPRGVI